MGFFRRGTEEIEDTYEDVEMVIGDVDEYGNYVSKTTSKYVNDGSDLLEDDTLRQHVLFSKDEKLLLDLGNLDARGYRYPLNLDIDILDLFGRNLLLYEAMANHPRTGIFIDANDFADASGIEIGAKIYNVVYTNHQVSLGYLKEYLEYLNIKPTFDVISEMLLVYGWESGEDDEYEEDGYDSFSIPRIYENYIKWW